MSPPRPIRIYQVNAEGHEGTFPRPILPKHPTPWCATRPRTRSGLCPGRNHAAPYSATTPLMRHCSRTPVPASGVCPIPRRVAFPRLVVAHPSAAQAAARDLRCRFALNRAPPPRPRRPAARLFRRRSRRNRLRARCFRHAARGLRSAADAYPAFWFAHAKRSLASRAKNGAAPRERRGPAEPSSRVFIPRGRDRFHAAGHRRRGRGHHGVRSI